MLASDFRSTKWAVALFHFKTLDQSLWRFRNIDCGRYLNLNIHFLSTLRALIALQRNFGRLDNIVPAQAIHGVFRAKFAADNWAQGWVGFEITRRRALRGIGFARSPSFRVPWVWESGAIA